MSGARLLWLAVGAVALTIGTAGYALLRLGAEPPKFNAVDESAVARAAAEFKISHYAHAPNAHGEYGVDHSGQVYVIDTEGRLRLFFRSHDAAPGSIAHDLRLLIDRGSA